MKRIPVIRKSRKNKTVKRLKYPSDVQRFCASLINELNNERLDDQGNIKLEVISKITSLAKVLLSAQLAEMQREELQDHEDRISALEAQEGY